MDNQGNAIIFTSDFTGILSGIERDSAICETVYLQLEQGVIGYELRELHFPGGGR